MLYNSKIIISGNFVEIYEYDKHFSDMKKNQSKILTSLELSILNKEREKFSFEKIERDEDDYLKSYVKIINEETGEITIKEIDRTNEVQKRSMQNIHRIINSNLNQRRTSEKFYTLTFKENMQDRKKAIKEFNKFVYKLRRKLDKKIDYLATLELQKRGAIHFHVLFFNLKFMKNDEIEKMWGNGFVKLKSVKSEEVAFYIVKYITKDIATGREKGQRRYLHSRGLKKPIEIKTDNIIHDDFMNENVTVIAKNEYENDFVGSMKYTRLYFKKGVDIDDVYTKYKTKQ